MFIHNRCILNNGPEEQTKIVRSLTREKPVEHGSISTSNTILCFIISKIRVELKLDSFTTLLNNRSFGTDLKHLEHPKCRISHRDEDYNEDI